MINATIKQPKRRGSLYSIQLINFNALLAQRIRNKFNKSRLVIFDINGEYAQAFEGYKKVKHTINWPPFFSLAKLVAEFGCVGVTPQGGSKRDAFSYGNVIPLVKIIQQLADDNRFTNIVNLNGGQPLSNQKEMWETEIEKEVDYLFGKKSGEEQDWDVHIIN